MCSMNFQDCQVQTEGELEERPKCPIWQENKERQNLINTKEKESDQQLEITRGTQASPSRTSGNFGNGKIRPFSVIGRATSPERTHHPWPLEIEALPEANNSLSLSSKTPSMLTILEGDDTLPR